MVHIISWNILYRKHEEKYNPNSIILKTYTNEKNRIIDTINLLQKYMKSDTIVCLQEVSYDAISILMRFFEHTHNIFFYNVRKSEYLVTIAPRDFKLFKSYRNSISNGFLIIHNNKYFIVNCHLIPQRYTRYSVMDYLLNLLSQNELFIVGDFNELYKNIKKQLSKRYTCPYYGKTYKRKAIDQIIFNIDISYTTRLIKQKNISDHHAIELIF